MRIAENVEMLELQGERGTLYPVLTWDDLEIVLIDTGFPWQFELTKEAISKTGFSLEKITKVILTHQDIDHIGCAKILAGLGAEILAHEIEAPYIQGDQTPIRIADMEKRLPELNKGELSFYEQVKKSVPYLHVRVDKSLTDGELLNICGGIEAIHTPGHLPGHMSLLLKKSNIIVAGDAANIVDGVLTGANPQYTRDMPQAQLSFQKITNRKPTAIVCYHGGII